MARREQGEGQARVGSALIVNDQRLLADIGHLDEAQPPLTVGGDPMLTVGAETDRLVRARAGSACRRDGPCP